MEDKMKFRHHTWQRQILFSFYFSYANCKYEYVCDCVSIGECVGKCVYMSELGPFMTYITPVALWLVGGSMVKW